MSKTGTFNLQEGSHALSKRRYVIAFLIFLACVVSYSQRVNLSFALVDMVNVTKIQSNNMNTTECPDMRDTTDTKENVIGHGIVILQLKPVLLRKAEFSWNAELQGLILSSTYIGYAIAQFPGGFFCERVGVKKMILMSIIIGSLCNLLSPIAARTDPYLLFVAHLIKGLGQGLQFAATPLLSARWFPKPEKGFLSAFVLSGYPLGAFLGSVISGPVCALEFDNVWPLAFYIFGFIGIFVSIFIIIFYVENPADDPNISEEELKYILENTNTVDTAKNGLLNSGPQFAQAIAGITACLFSLYININDTSKINLARKGCNSLAAILYVFGLSGIYLSGCDIFWNEFFLFLTSAAPGFTFGGILIVAVDMTPTYCGPLFGLASTIASLSGFIIPILTGILTKHEQTMVQWHKVFLITVVIVTLGGVVFLVWGSAEIQPYDPVYRKEENASSQHEKNTSEVTSTRL